MKNAISTVWVDMGYTVGQRLVSRDDEMIVLFALLRKLDKGLRTLDGRLFPRPEVTVFDDVDGNVFAGVRGDIAGVSYLAKLINGKLEAVAV